MIKFPEYEAKRLELFNDASTSDWLKRQIVIADNRDILDVLNDIEVLQGLMMVKWNEAVEQMKDKDR